MIKKPDTRNQIPENAGNNIVKLRGYKKLIAYQNFLEISKLIEEEGKLINGLINSLKERTRI